MSKEANNLRRKFSELLAGAGAVSEYGTVKSVDEAKRTCDVQVGGIVRQGVLLYAIENADLKGFVLIPKKGSGVIVSRIGAGSRLYVEMTSEIDRVICTTGDTEFTITEKGFKLVRGDFGLLQTLSDLCDAIAQLTVTTGVGPSGVPINIAAFQKIQKELKQYMEG